MGSGGRIGFFAGQLLERRSGCLELQIVELVDTLLLQRMKDKEQCQKKCVHGSRNQLVPCQTNVTRLLAAFRLAIVFASAVESLMDETVNIEKLDHRTVYRGRILTLVVDRIIEPSGIEVEREVVRHRGAAVILPLTQDHEVVLVRQFRYAVERFIWEVPAGHVASGERPEETAERELVEETGYYPHRLEKLAAVYPSPGFSDEVMHIFLATQLEKGPASPEADESIEVGHFAIEDALTMVSEAPFSDGKTLLSLMLMRNRAANESK
jgi:ADP-ribose pyrophosphatase